MCTSVVFLYSNGNIHTYPYISEPFKFGDDATVSRPESTTDFFPVNITEVGDSLQLSYEWTRNGAVLLSNGRVQYLINGINFTDGQGGMYRNDSGVYKLTISNVAGSSVTYLTLDVQCECMVQY